MLAHLEWFTKAGLMIMMIFVVYGYCHHVYVYDYDDYDYVSNHSNNEQ